MHRELFLCKASLADWSYPWLIRDGQISFSDKNFNQKIIKQYITDAFDFLEREIKILKETDREFTYEDENRLKSIFETLISARRIYQTEYSKITTDDQN
jgi:hypothetical protein